MPEATAPTFVRTDAGAYLARIGPKQLDRYLIERDTDEPRGWVVFLPGNTEPDWTLYDTLRDAKRWATAHAKNAGSEIAPRQTDLAKLDEARNRLATFEAHTAQALAEGIYEAESASMPAAAAALWDVATRLNITDDVSRRYNDR